MPSPPAGPATPGGAPKGQAHERGQSVDAHPFDEPIAELLASLVDDARHLKVCADSAAKERDVGRAMLGDVVEKGVEAALQAIDGPHVARQERPVEKVLRRVAHRRDVEVSFGREVVVEKALRDACRARELVDGHLVVRAGAEELGAELHQLPAPLVDVESCARRVASPHVPVISLHSFAALPFSVRPSIFTEQ